MHLSISITSSSGCAFALQVQHQKSTILAYKTTCYYYCYCQASEILCVLQIEN